MFDATGESNHLFGCTPHEISDAIAGQQPLASGLFRVSAGDRLPPSLPHNSIIIQDVPFPDLNDRLHFLVEELLYPLWLHAIPFRFLSLLPFTAYSRTTLSSAAIHNAPDELEHHLLCRQLCALLSLPPPPSIAATDRNAESILDTAQCRAAYHVHGPICVLAPAGSGKTKTLVQRIVHMTGSGIPPAEIMALAYNTKAGEEMKVRLAAYGLTGVTVRTFHSLGYEICRSSGWHFDPLHADIHTRESLENALHVFGDARFVEESGQLPLLVAALSRAKSELVLPLLHLPFGKQLISFEEFFTEYFALQQKHRKLSFDDMVYVAVRILLDNDSLLGRYQERFRYVLVDEFQDLNAAQRLLVRLLALPTNNLFAVGDDDQMIYGWRGATIRHLTEFRRQHPSATQIVLNTNYRSSRDVVLHSRRLIDHNTQRIVKNIQPRPDAQQGSFAVDTGATLSAQAAAAAAWITQLCLSEHLEWRDFAILFRTNVLQFPVALALEAAHIPHTPLRYELLFRTHIGRVVIILTRALPVHRDAAVPDLRMLLGRFRISRKILDQITCWRSLEESSSWNRIPEWERKRLYHARTGLSRLRTMAALPEASTRAILQTAAELFDIHRKTSVAHARVEADEPDDREVFEVFLSLADRYPLFSDFSRMVEHWNIQEDTVCAQEREHNEVTLSTIHRTKGNEYRNVVYYNMSAPSTAAAPESLEEERRVAYVALTRARDHLLVTAPTGRQSPFLSEAALDPVFSGTSSPGLRLRRLTCALHLPPGMTRLQRQARLAAIVRELTLRKKIPHKKVTRK